MQSDSLQMAPLTAPIHHGTSAVPRTNCARRSDPHTPQYRERAWHSAGQGKCATTILADQGDSVTVITDLPYSIRSRHVVVSPRKGTRAMHHSTLRIPTQSYTDYITTNKQYLSGVGAPQREPPYGSQHVSRVCFGRDDQDWGTSYKHTFVNTDAQSPSKLHQPSLENRMNMSEGAGLKRVMTVPGPEFGNRFWSQYNRVHNVLGARLGPGVPHETPVRHQYNPLTGADEGVSWTDNNRRISGNRVLYNGYRKNTGDQFVLG